MRSWSTGVALALAAAVPSGSAAQEARSSEAAAAVAGICRDQLARVEALSADRWAAAELRATTAVWRDLDCAVVLGLAETEAAAPDRRRVRWVAR